MLLLFNVISLRLTLHIVKVLVCSFYQVVERTPKHCTIFVTMTTKFIKARATDVYFEKYHVCCKIMHLT